MSIVLNTEAPNTSSVNNEMLFVAYEATKTADPVTYPDYSYICDIYVSSVMIARLKSRPYPDNNRGIFDVSKALQAYATYGLKAGSVKEDYTIKIDYLLKFGEEYDFVTYPNLLVDSSNRSCFTTYKVRPFTASNVLTNGLASNMPAIKTYHESQAYHMIPLFSNVTGVVDLGLTVTYYNEAGSSVGSDYFDNTDYILNTIRQVNIASGTVPATTSYALVTGADTFRINYKCNGKYTPYTLAWLNPYGGYDSQSFGLVSKKSIDIMKKDFAQIPYQMNVSGEISYEVDNVYYGSKKVFSSMVTTKLHITSHLLSAEEYTWLAELIASPDVYFYDSTQGKFIPVRISQNNYDYRNYSNSKLTPLELDIEFSDIYNAQNL